MSILLAVMVVAVAPAAGFGGADSDQAANVAVSTDSAVSSADNSAGQGESVNESNESAEFAMDADIIDRCGFRCRNVTANLTNTGNATAENTTATVRLSAGNASIWEEEYQLGNISANESIERTEILEVDPRDVFYVSQNDWRIDITVTVDWDDGETTFRERRRVV